MWGPKGLVVVVVVEGQHTRANTEQGLRKEGIMYECSCNTCTEAPTLSLCSPPGASSTPARVGGGGGGGWGGGIEEGVGSTLRLDILSVDGTITWEEMGDAPMQA